MRADVNDMKTGCEAGGRASMRAGRRAGERRSRQAGRQASRQKSKADSLLLKLQRLQGVVRNCGCTRAARRAEIEFSAIFVTSPQALHRRDLVEHSGGSGSSSSSSSSGTAMASAPPPAPSSILRPAGRQSGGRAGGRAAGLVESKRRPSDGPIHGATDGWMDHPTRGQTRQAGERMSW